jgi:hypothetical protein
MLFTFFTFLASLLLSVLLCLAFAGLRSCFPLLWF